MSHVLWTVCLSLSNAGRNEPLKKDRPKWKSDYPMTEGQLRSKRDEFWDTAPAFEGRKEIWDALKAAAVALECNDHELAQAIVDGASITLPHGEDRRGSQKHILSLILSTRNDLFFDTSLQVLSPSVMMNSGTATSCPSTAWLHRSTSSQSAATRTPATAQSPP